MKILIPPGGPRTRLIVLITEGGYRDSLDESRYLMDIGSPPKTGANARGGERRGQDGGEGIPGWNLQRGESFE